MCNETEKHQRWKRYRYFIASISSSIAAHHHRPSDSAFYPWETSAPSCQPAHVNWCWISVPKPCGIKPGGAPGCFGGDGGMMEPQEQDRCAQRWVASGWALSHVSSLLIIQPDPALRQPPHGSIPELGGGVREQDPAGMPNPAATHSFQCERNGRWKGNTLGILLVVSTRGKERARGFKNNRICSALLKIEKVALDSSPTKGLKVKQAPNRERLSTK